MEDVVMTNKELEAWRMIGLDIGLEFDELGHPYRRGELYQLGGEELNRIYDWRPLEDDGDAFRLQVHYQISMVCDHGVTLFKCPAGVTRYVTYNQSVHLPLHHQALRRSIFETAALIVREKQKNAVRANSVQKTSD